MFQLPSEHLSRCSIVGTKTGDYSVKSGYYVAIGAEGDGPEAEGDFKWTNHVWKLDCAPKVKLFVWKVLKGAVPVGERLLERHIDIDPRCKRCGSNESITHLLFHCQFAQRVWHLAPLATAPDFRGMIDLMADWPALSNLKALPPTGIASGNLVPWIFWNIWKARNRFVFEGVSASPEDTLSSAIRLAREWSISGKPEKTEGKKHRLIEVPVLSGTTRIQTDAAWCSARKIAGIGGIIHLPPRNREIQLKMEFIASPLMAEGLALREVMLRCQDLELHNLRFESDSSLLVNCLNQVVSIAEMHSVVADIIELSRRFASVAFVWIPRERNVEADMLAKRALNVAEPLLVGNAVIAPN